MQFRFRFYIGGRFKFERIYLSDSISQAWKLAKEEAANYPTSRFIEIANIK